MRLGEEAGRVREGPTVHAKVCGFTSQWVK